MKALQQLRSLALIFLTALALLPGLAAAQQYSNYYENRRIDADVRGQTWTLPTTLYLGLETANGSDTGCGTEAAWTSYARPSYASSLTNWAGTQSAGSTTASTGTGGQTSNNVAISWATPGSGPTTVTGFCVFDAGLTTLSAAISTTGATSMTVTSASQFPGSGNYYVLIDSEVVQVTAGQGTTTWTITRGALGTTAATHSNGAAVSGMMLWRNTLTSSKVINSGDTVQFPIGSLTYTVD
ncbi:MAG: hypothetical protein KIT35_22015 [Piscinibacter sp.]|uniref:phage tail fiber protein n=1 Tax=Piscinibacter sp. TaxID=1903157 RepID=UPI00258942FD|nr:hypothetical protein [Piscinibacter sp.]MCW5666517.1 hypothetical protein [Piscinibacter sp.]